MSWPSPLRSRWAMGGNDREPGVHAGDHIGDGDADALRAAAFAVVALAGDAHQAAHALEHQVVRGARGIGPLGPKPVTEQ
jgi:hypothetical protein